MSEKRTYNIEIPHRDLWPEVADRLYIAGHNPQREEKNHSLLSLQAIYLRLQSLRFIECGFIHEAGRNDQLCALSRRENNDGCAHNGERGSDLRHFIIYVLEMLRITSVINGDHFGDMIDVRRAARRHIANLDKRTQLAYIDLRREKLTTREFVLKRNEIVTEFRSHQREAGKPLIEIRDKLLDIFCQEFGIEGSNAE